jgi:biopolymer transport protein TolR
MMQFLWAIHPCRKWPYGFVVEVMSEVRRAGVDKLGMITELPEDRK